MSAVATSGWSGPSAFSPIAQRALVERLGVGVAALGLVQRGQVVERGGDIGVIGAERLLADRESALVERLGVGVAALGLVQHGQIVEHGRDIGVIGAERLLGDRQRALVERLGVGVAALACIQRRPDC